MNSVVASISFPGPLAVDDSAPSSGVSFLVAAMVVLAPLLRASTFKLCAPTIVRDRVLEERHVPAFFFFFAIPSVLAGSQEAYQVYYTRVTCKVVHSPGMDVRTYFL